MSVQSSGSFTTAFMPTPQSCWWCPAGSPNFSSSARPTAPTGPSATTVSAAFTSMPGMYAPSTGVPSFSTP